MPKRSSTSSAWASSTKLLLLMVTLFAFIILALFKLWTSKYCSTQLTRNCSWYREKVFLTWSFPAPVLWTLLEHISCHRWKWHALWPNSNQSHRFFSYHYHHLAWGEFSSFARNWTWWEFLHLSLPRAKLAARDWRWLYSSQNKAEQWWHCKLHVTLLLTFPLLPASEV